MPLAASAAPVPSGHTLAPNTHFYVPPPAQGSTQQALQLLRHGQVKDAALIADMEATPQGVWFDGESAAQVTEGTAGANQAAQQVYLQVRQTMFEAALQHAVPLLVAYNIPGRRGSGLPPRWRPRRRARRAVGLRPRRPRTGPNSQSPRPCGRAPRVPRGRSPEADLGHR